MKVGDESIFKRLLFIGSIFLLLANAVCSVNLKAAKAASIAGEKTLVLYDASSGGIPDSSVIGFTAFPPQGASVSYEDTSTVFDTTGAGTDTYAGWAAGASTTGAFPILDPINGFHVNISLQIEVESHDNDNRSGFSIIVLDSRARGIEMSFWQNEIWVQNDDSLGGLFTHGEGVSFDTTSGILDYEVRVSGDYYTLTANSQTVLTGPLRDYSAFDRFPDPYETPNFLFLGDNTTSAQAKIRLRFLSVTGTEQVLPSGAATSTNENLPQPADTPSALASATPFPTPIPAKPTVDICPSGWLFVSVMIGNILMIKSRRREKTKTFSG